MMARSIKGSNQRPDTLMQDRTSANSMKVLLQRTAGPYIWVKSRRSVVTERCPLYPRKRTNSGHLKMSASCQKRTPAPQRKISLFDHLVGAGDDRSRYGYAQQLRGCEIDDKFKLRRLLDRQFTRFRAAKNLVRVLGRAPEHVQKTWTIRYQASGFDVLSDIEKRWQSRGARRLYDAVQVEIYEWVANDVQGLRIPLECLEGERDVLCLPNVRCGDINPKRAAQFLNRTALQQGICIAGIGNDG